MKVLVAVDFSAVTERTLTAVRTCCASEALSVVVLHVAEPDPSFVGWDAGPDVVRDQVASTFRRERDEVARIVADLQQAGIDAVGHTVQGAIVETIVAEAVRFRADLIAVGSHGHGAAYDLVVGSVSSGVIRSSPVPVLVVTSPR